MFGPRPAGDRRARAQLPPVLEGWSQGEEGEAGVGQVGHG